MHLCVKASPSGQYAPNVEQNLRVAWKTSGSGFVLTDFLFWQKSIGRSSFITFEFLGTSKFCNNFWLWKSIDACAKLWADLIHSLGGVRKVGCFLYVAPCPFALWPLKIWVNTIWFSAPLLLGATLLCMCGPHPCRLWPLIPKGIAGISMFLAGWWQASTGLQVFTS